MSPLFLQKRKKSEKLFTSIPSSDGKTGKQIALEYKKLLAKIEEIKQLVPSTLTKDNQLQELIDTRNTLLNNFIKEINNKKSILQSVIKMLNKKLQGKIKLTLESNTNKKDLIDYILSCNLEGIGENRLKWIQDNHNLSPQLLANAIKQGKDSLLDSGWGVTEFIANSLVKLDEFQILSIEEIELPNTLVVELNTSTSGENFKH